VITREAPLQTSLLSVTPPVVRHGARTVEAFGPFPSPAHLPLLTASQPLHGSLVPFDHRTLDSIGLEKSEDSGEASCAFSAVVVVG